MKGKNRGILTFSILFLVVLAILLKNSVTSKPKEENNSPDISIAKSQDTELSSRDNNINNEIEGNKESILSKYSIGEVQNVRKPDGSKKEKLENKKNISNIINKQSEDQDISDKEKDNEIITKPSPNNPIQDKDKNEEKDDDRIEDKDPGEDNEPVEDNEKNKIIQLYQENPDDRFGPIIRGK